MRPDRQTTRAATDGASATEVAERVGFEPTCRLPDKTLSRRPRYDHFGTSPSVEYECEQDIIPVAWAVLPDTAAVTERHLALWNLIRTSE